MRACPCPPNKLKLLEYMQDECDKQKLKMPVQNPKILPDKDWIIVCLSSLNPDHLIFQKSYVPEPVVKRKKEEMENEVLGILYTI